MLKVLGQIFAQTEDGMKELETVLTDAGFELAYVNTKNATIIKEVPDAEFGDTTA